MVQLGARQDALFLVHILLSPLSALPLTLLLFGSVFPKSQIGQGWFYVVLHEHQHEVVQTWRPSFWSESICPDAIM